METPAFVVPYPQGRRDSRGSTVGVFLRPAGSGHPACGQAAFAWRRAGLAVRPKVQRIPADSAVFLQDAVLAKLGGGRTAVPILP